MNAPHRKFSKSTALLLLILGMLIPLALAIGTLFILNIQRVISNFRFQNICHDYHMVHHAFVVGADGKGIDSVSLCLRDFSNYNTLYKTFTDREGRFELFNDFNAHTLADFPFSYELYVSIGGFKDTIIYTFERYRICHFRKVDGPDTIVVDPLKNTDFVLHLRDTVRVMVDDYISHTPFLSTSLKKKPPPSMREAVYGWESTKFGVMSIDSRDILIAICSMPDHHLRQKSGIQKNGLYYVIDRNGNRNLNDDVYRPLHVCTEKKQIMEPECGVRTCCATDTLRVRGTDYRLSLKIRGLPLHGVLHFERSDGLLGSIEYEKKKYRVLVWDYGFTNYRDLQKVQIAIDHNNDGVFTTEKGDVELFESAKQTMFFSTKTFTLDTIINFGKTLVYTPLYTLSGIPVKTPMKTGSWASDFNAHYAHSMSLHQECARHTICVLYFFEGSSKSHMEDLEFQAMVAVLRKRLGKIGCIGINRKSTGPPYLKMPVIEENQGWIGPIVSQFHHYLEKEIICLDSLATIIYRGEPGRETLEGIWSGMHKSDGPSLCLEYDNLLQNAVIIGHSTSLKH